MQALDPVGAVAELVHDRLAYARHNRHVKHNVDGVGDFDADLRKRGADGAHGIGDNVHGAALIAASCNVEQHFIRFLRVLPVVGRAGVFFFPGTDKGSVLYTGHVVDSGPVEVTAGKLFLIELNQLACGASLCAQLLELFFRTVNPDGLVRCEQFFHFFKP